MAGKVQGSCSLKMHIILDLGDTWTSHRLMWRPSSSQQRPPSPARQASTSLLSWRSPRLPQSLPLRMCNAAGAAPWDWHQSPHLHRQYLPLRMPPRWQPLSPLLQTKLPQVPLWNLLPSTLVQSAQMTQSWPARAPGFYADAELGPLFCADYQWALINLWLFSLDPCMAAL